MIPALSLVQRKKFDDGVRICVVNNAGAPFRQQLNNVTVSSGDRTLFRTICRLSDDLFLFTSLSQTTTLIAQQCDIHDYDSAIQLSNNTDIFDENGNRVSFDMINRLLHVSGIELVNVTMLLQFMVTTGLFKNKITVICTRLDVNSNRILTNGGYFSFGLPLYKSLYDNSLQNDVNAVQVPY